jgi:hypothetical protein
VKRIAGVYVWKDGTSPVYLNWALGEPSSATLLTSSAEAKGNGRKSRRSCVVIGARDFRFHTRSCEDANKFICRRSKITDAQFSNVVQKGDQYDQNSVRGR